SHRGAKRKPRKWGGSEVRIITTASTSCGLLNRSHTKNMDLPVSHRFRSSHPSMPCDETNFGIGTLACAALLRRVWRSSPVGRLPPLDLGDLIGFGTAGSHDFHGRALFL